MQKFKILQQLRVSRSVAKDLTAVSVHTPLTAPVILVTLLGRLSQSHPASPVPHLGSFTASVVTRALGSVPK